MSLLNIVSASKNGPGDFRLDNITLSQQRLERVAIAGETGAGKSTLLKLIAGLVQPDGGTLEFENNKIIGPEEQLVPGHPGIAYLSQHFELQKSLRVEQVLEYASRLPEDESQKLYHVCQIDHLLTRRTDQLSGGEKQRVAMCRLLASKPRLLLLDEPYSHLDMVHKHTLKRVVDNLGKELGITCILVSHDPQDTLSWADTIIAMKDGRIVQSGRPSDLYYRPVDEYTAGLFGKYNLIDSRTFKTFAKIPRVRRARETGWRSLFLRPEQIRIVSKRDTAVRGVVTDARFFGGYWEVVVAVKDYMFVVHTRNGETLTEKTVYLGIAPGALWSL